MNGLRPAEILEVLRAAEEAAQDGLPSILATFVSIDGSVYGRAGALAVFIEGDARPGGISIAETEGALRARLEEAARGKAGLCSLKLAEDDPLLGFGLGAPGSVEVFLEPVTAQVRALLRQVRDELLRGKGVVCSLLLEGPRAGERQTLACDDPRARECYEQESPQLMERVAQGQVQRAFLCPIRPMGKAMIFGSSPAARVLSRHLAELGFFVHVADPRPGRLRRGDFDRERVMLVEGGWEQARAVVHPDEDTYVVIMTRSYALDLETLQGALQSPARYAAVTGPAPRSQRMLRELDALGIRPRPGVFFAPAGLDIGAESRAETALAVAAEILAVRAGRKKGRLSSAAKPVAAVHSRAAVPGLILAAGRGRRFSSGNKLSALLDGRPVLRQAVENALASRLDPVIVVLGCEAEAALATLDGLEDSKLRVVFNPGWKGGKASSIVCGLREVPHAAAGVVSLMGDMPRVKPWLIDRVLTEFELSGRLTFPVYPGPKGPIKGHPTAFPRSLFGAIRALTGDDTAMEAVRERWGQAVKIPLDDASTQIDVDTPADLDLLLDAE